MRRSLSLVALFGLLCVGSMAQAGQITSVTVTGQFPNGVNLSLTCVPAGKALLSGYGALSGKNPQTGQNFSYPIVITNASTSNGSLNLYGRFVNGPPVAITAQVPAGKLTLTQPLPNGGKSTLTGRCTVAVK